MSFGDLQRQIDNLTARVQALELRSHGQDGSASFTGSSSTPTVADFSVVSHDEGYRQNQDGDLSWDRRLELARESGRFIVRCLEGRDRRNSGQHQINLPKRVYILVRDGKGNVSRDPVEVYFRFSDIKPRVQVGSGYGDSIFVGFASQREAQEAVRAAGLGWPANLRR